MKFAEIFEEISDYDIGVAEQILVDCQPWLSTINYDLTLPVYRGEYTVWKTKGGNSSDGDIDTVAMLKVRKDRKPLDSSLEVTKHFNRSIKNAGCIANRTNSVFVTGSKSTASAYGKVFVVFPIGPFNFTWNTKFADLYVATKNVLPQLIAEPTPRDIKKFLPAAEEQIVDLLKRKYMEQLKDQEHFKIFEKISKTQQQKNLNTAIKDFATHAGIDEIDVSKLSDKNYLKNYLGIDIDNFNKWIDHQMLNLADIQTRKYINDNMEKINKKLQLDVDKKVQQIMPEMQKNIQQRAREIAKKSTDQIYSQEKFDNFVGKYFKNTDLISAIQSKKEIMVDCDRYYIVSIDYFNQKLLSALNKLIQEQS